MRRRRAIRSAGPARVASWVRAGVVAGVVAGLVVGVGACSVGGAGDVVDVQAEPPSAKLSPPELDRRLLAAELLGPVWIEQTRLTYESGAEAPAPFDPITWCPAASDRVERLAGMVSGGGAMVELSEAGTVGGVHEVTQQVWSDALVARFVDSV